MRALIRPARVLGGLITDLARFSGAIAALTIMAMCLLVTGAVVTRYLFDIPLVWVPEIVGYLMVALVFLALGDAMLAGSHIRLDVFVTRLSKRLRHVIELLTLALSTGVAGLFTWHGATTVLRSYEFGRTDAFGALRAPLYIPQLALPAGLCVLTLVLAFLVCRKFYAVMYRADEADVVPGSQLEGRHT